MSQIQAESLVGAFGAEVKGVDLSQAQSEATNESLKRLLVQHKLLVFRDLALEPEDLIRLGRQFGELDQHPFIQALPDYPEVLPIVKEAGEKRNFGGGWHSEVSFYEKPALATLLYAQEVPSQGGDTLMADMVAAFEALSPNMRNFLEGLTAIHSAENIYTPQGVLADREVDATTEVELNETANRRVLHPLVRTIPETGEKLLYVNEAFTVGIKGFRREEANAILGYLFRHVTKADFCSRIHWRPGTLAFWDNRSTQHYALNDYSGERRAMLRVVVQGEQPV